MSVVRQTVPRIFAVIFGVVTLLLLGFNSSQSGLLTGWASFLAGVALILGILNLLNVHIRRIGQGNFYSLALVFGLVVTITLGLTGLFGGADTIFNYVQAPLEAALGALLAFFLFFAGLRMLRRRLTVWSLLFFGTVIIVLLGITPMPSFLSDIFVGINGFISLIFVSAGMRGILIGVALGTITVALRVILGSEQPYNK